MRLVVSLGGLPAWAHQLGLGAVNAQGLVSRAGSAGLLDGCKLRSGIGLGNGVDAGDLGGTGSVLWCGVATTRLLVAATREDNEACLVVLQAGDVGLLGCHAAVATAGIDSDSYGLGILAADACGRELLQSEATAHAHLAVVADGGAAHDWAQLVHRAGCDGGGLGGTRKTAALLLGWLVEEALDTALPVLVEVRVRHDVVVLHHGNSCYGTTER
mmetsp:Transcript_22061/g.39557  ORF Transcript_22061/g.39557 Transcript_22061/m.39557 type:complete len:215 (+) Transcript_22061:514-1158(+)